MNITYSIKCSFDKMRSILSFKLKISSPLRMTTFENGGFPKFILHWYCRKAKNTQNTLGVCMFRLFKFCKKSSTGLLVILFRILLVPQDNWKLAETEIDTQGVQKNSKNLSNGNKSSGRFSSKVKSYAHILCENAVVDLFFLWYSLTNTIFCQKNWQNMPKIASSQLQEIRSRV